MSYRDEVDTIACANVKNLPHVTYTNEGSSAVGSGGDLNSVKVSPPPCHTQTPPCHTHDCRHLSYQKVELANKDALFHQALDQRDAAIKRANDAEKEVKRFVGALADANDALADAKKQAEKFKDDAAANNILLHIEKSLVNELKRKLDVCENARTSNLEKLLETVNAQAADLEKLLEVEKMQTAELTKKLKSAQESFLYMQDRAQERLDAARDLQDQLDAKTAECTRLEKALDAMTVQCNQFQAFAQETQDRLLDTQQRLVAKTAECTTLTETIQKKDACRIALEKALDAMRSAEASAEAKKPAPESPPSSALSTLHVFTATIDASADPPQKTREQLVKKVEKALVNLYTFDAHEVLAPVLKKKETS